MRIGRVIGQQHLLDAGELGGSFRSTLGALARDQHVDIGAEGCGRRQRLVGRVLDPGIVVFGNQQRGHQSTPASVLSLLTSSATSLTLTPALRPAGSVVLRTSRRGVRSTPVSAAVFSAIGFFFAFMMFGSEA